MIPFGQTDQISNCIDGFYETQNERGLRQKALVWARSGFGSFSIKRTGRGRRDRSVESAETASGSVAAPRGFARPVNSSNKPGALGFEDSRT